MQAFLGYWHNGLATAGACHDQQQKWTPSAGQIILSNHATFEIHCVFLVSSYSPCRHVFKMSDSLLLGNDVKPLPVCTSLGLSSSQPFLVLLTHLEIKRKFQLFFFSSVFLGRTIILCPNKNSFTSKVHSKRSRISPIINSFQNRYLLIIIVYDLRCTKHDFTHRTLFYAKNPVFSLYCFLR